MKSGEFSPEFKELVNIATTISLRGRYDPEERERSGFSMTDDRIIHGVIFDEGGQRRNVIDAEKNRHRISYLGYISVYSDDISGELALLTNGGIWQQGKFGEKSGKETRRFITASEALEILVA
jgi:hypothetical protein